MSLTDRFDKQQAQLAALQATESELIDGPDAALQVLGPPTDPIRVRATLGILLRDKRHQQAADLIHDRHPDEKWIDVAAYIFAFLGGNRARTQTRQTCRRLSGPARDASNASGVCRRSSGSMARTSRERIASNSMRMAEFGHRGGLHCDRLAGSVVVSRSCES